jgi:hemerythrin-like domain-containing protein
LTPAVYCLTELTMSKAIDDLKHEHEAILSALKILDTISESIGSGSTPGKDDLGSFIGFLKEFADKCHHGKEEGMLFPALIAAGMPEHGGPVAVMLAEHLQGRDYIREMDHSLSSGPDYVTFAHAARAYSALLKSHIQKENNVLFPMAEDALEVGKLEQLYESFEEHEEKVIGHGRHEELHQMLKDLQSKYMK